jgi:hypothetical protein
MSDVPPTESERAGDVTDEIWRDVVGFEDYYPSQQPRPRQEPGTHSAGSRPAAAETRAPTDTSARRAAAQRTPEGHPLQQAWREADGHRRAADAAGRLPSKHRARSSKLLRAGSDRDRTPTARNRRWDGHCTPWPPCIYAAQRHVLRGASNLYGVVQSATPSAESF